MQSSSKHLLKRSKSSKSFRVLKRNDKSFTSCKTSSFDLTTTNINQKDDEDVYDLEWDKDKDFLLKNESDAMSLYDLDEIIQQKLFEFEMMSNSTRSLALFDDINPPSENLTYLNDLYHIKYPTFSNGNNSLLCSPSYSCNVLYEFKKSSSNCFNRITFDCDSVVNYESTSHSNTNSLRINLIYNSFYSMPNLGQVTAYNDLKLLCKHLSLIDLKCVYCKREVTCHKSDQIDSKMKRMSHLAKLVSYWNRIGDSFRQLIHSTLKLIDHSENKSKNKSSFFKRLFAQQQQQKKQQIQLYPISEETIETYDIIELDDLVETIKSHACVK